MLIYNSCSSSIFGASGSSTHYKSASTQRKASNRAKASKRIALKPRKRRRRRAPRKLNAKNVKFLKKLGLRVKKQ